MSHEGHLPLRIGVGVQRHCPPRRVRACIASKHKSQRPRSATARLWQSGSNVGGLVGMAKSSGSNAPANGTGKLSVIEKSPNYLFHQ
jgi:hypothetical protein